MITDELAAFSAEYKFLFGVSLDGPPQMHDPYRRTRDGQPTHALVLKGIERLEKHGVDFNILALVKAGGPSTPTRFRAFGSSPRGSRASGSGTTRLGHGHGHWTDAARASSAFATILHRSASV